jgi:hypothetical protein
MNVSGVTVLLFNGVYFGYTNPADFAVDKAFHRRRISQLPQERLRLRLCQAVFMYQQSGLVQRGGTVKHVDVKGLTSN